MALASLSSSLYVSGSLERHEIRIPKATLSESIKKPFSEVLQQFPKRLNVTQSIKNTSRKLLDALVESTFQVVDQLPSQTNFAPVEEIGEAVKILDIEGEIPSDFPEGVYIRNGPNPVSGSLKTAHSVFGKSKHVWFEGEGMLHAVYFKRERDGKWDVSYKNRYVETDTFKIDRERNKSTFLPALQGNPAAVLAAFFLNQLRYGKVIPNQSNTGVLEHSGKIYSTEEYHLPQKIDLSTLETLEPWDINGSWNRTFTSHPKKTPGKGELVIIGTDAIKPYFVLGVISADGRKLVHQVDLKFQRCCLCHEVGVTEKYNVIMDFPLILDVRRVLTGGPLIKYEKGGYARIGVMPRYGDAKSVTWFDVESHCTFHILNSFEEGDEVVVRGCRALDSVIPGPDSDNSNFQWFSRSSDGIPMDSKNEEEDEGIAFPRSYEWRLNMKTGEVREKFLTGSSFGMEFPFINQDVIGLRNKYGYTQVVDSALISSGGIANFGKFAKLYFDEQDTEIPEGEEGYKEFIKVEYHSLDKNQFCSGLAFVPKNGGQQEDDGWIISFVHNEDTNVSQVYIIDTKKFTGEPVAKITLPQRVPYGFHGTFISKQAQSS